MNVENLYKSTIAPNNYNVYCFSAPEELRALQTSRSQNRDVQLYDGFLQKCSNLWYRIQRCTNGIIILSF